MTNRRFIPLIACLALLACGISNNISPVSVVSATSSNQAPAKAGPDSSSNAAAKHSKIKLQNARNRSECAHLMLDRMLGVGASKPLPKHCMSSTESTNPAKKSTAPEKAESTDKAVEEKADEAQKQPVVAANDPPEWLNSIPRKDGWFFGVGKGPDTVKAFQEASLVIAAQLEIEVTSKSTDVMKDIRTEKFVDGRAVVRSSEGSQYISQSSQFLVDEVVKDIIIEGRYIDPKTNMEHLLVGLDIKALMARENAFVQSVIDRINNALQAVADGQRGFEHDKIVVLVEVLEEVKRISRSKLGRKLSHRWERDASKLERLIGKLLTCIEVKSAPAASISSAPGMVNVNTNNLPSILLVPLHSSPSLSDEDKQKLDDQLLLLTEESGVFADVLGSSFVNDILGTDQLQALTRCNSKECFAKFGQTLEIEYVLFTKSSEDGQIEISLVKLNNSNEITSRVSIGIRTSSEALRKIPRGVLSLYRNVFGANPAKHSAKLAKVTCNGLPLINSNLKVSVLGGLTSLPGTLATNETGILEIPVGAVYGAGNVWIEFKAILGNVRGAHRFRKLRENPKGRLQLKATAPAAMAIEVSGIKGSHKVELENGIKAAAKKKWGATFSKQHNKLKIVSHVTKRNAVKLSGKVSQAIEVSITLQASNGKVLSKTFRSGGLGFSQAQAMNKAVKNILHGVSNW
jgi:hypothetical protein